MKNAWLAVKDKMFYVDRNNFLREAFPQVYQGYSYGDELPSPRAAGVSQADLKKKASSIIKHHTLLCSSVSGGLGIPGGLAAPATLVADIAQYYGQLVLVAQKIGYLYGLPNLDNLDDEGEYKLLLGLINIMLGQGVNRAVLNVIKNYEKEIGKFVIKKCGKDKVFEKVVRFFVTKVAGEVMGKRGVSRVLGKVIPFVGGAASFTITWFSFKPACNRLLGYFETNVPVCA